MEDEVVMKDGQSGDAEASEQSVKSWRTKLAAQATKAVMSVAATATRQQVRLAVKTIRAAPRALPTAPAATIGTADATPPTDRQPIPSTKPGSAFTAAQAAKAAEALRATLALETLVCQRCGATVAASAVRCRCGYPLQSPAYEATVLTLGTNPRATPANDEDLKRPADRLSDSPTAIYTTADIPEAD